MLSSDWCTFSAKRKLVTHIINATNLLEGPEKNEYDDLLRKVISYRNAFAHGDMSTDGRKVRLSFFESSPRRHFLDDSYFELAEKVLNACFQKTIDLAQRMTGLVRKWKLANTFRAAWMYCTGIEMLEKPNKSLKLTP